MTAEEILSEIEKLPDNERERLNLHCAKQCVNLSWALITHPDQEMVTSSCLHFLGDAAQEWYSEWKKTNRE